MKSSSLWHVSRYLSGSASFTYICARICEYTVINLKSLESLQCGSLEHDDDIEFVLQYTVTESSQSSKEHNVQHHEFLEE